MIAAFDFEPFNSKRLGIPDYPSKPKAKKT